MELLSEINDFLTEGMVDPREIVSKMGPDASDVHVKTAPTKAEKKAKRDKTQKRIALATNTIGVLAAPAAISAALRDPRLKSKTPIEDARKAKGVPLKIAEKIGLKRLANNRKVLTAGAIGAVGLQIGNATGDAISAKYFSDEERKRKKEIKKAVDTLSTARRSGLVSTEEAIDTVSKLWGKKQPTPEQLVRASTEIRAGKRMVLVGTGLASGIGGAVAVDRLNEKNVNYKNPNVPRKVSVESKSLRKGKADDLEWAGKVSKVDTDKRQVFGWCSLTKVNGEDVVDRQGDYIPLDEVEKSAYNYVIHSRKGGDMHKRDGEAPLHTSDLIESFVVTPEKLEALGLDSDAVPHGWWVGFKVNDDSQWEAVKKGERAHFSIHGKGRRREISKSSSKVVGRS